MHGSHFLGAYSSTQKPIATSSGESEFYGMFKAGSHAVGYIQVCKDLGLEREAVVCADASAGIGMSQRKGLGR
eukprot:9585353-Lingulodinium_polyedra.AAC.1